MNPMNTLISQLTLHEDLTTHGEGLDKVVLAEAVKVVQEDFSDPLDGADFLLKLAEAGLL